MEIRDPKSKGSKDDDDSSWDERYSKGYGDSDAEAEDDYQGSAAYDDD